jgi:membrane protein
LLVPSLVILMPNELRTPVPPLSPSGFVRWLWQLAKDVWTEYSEDNAGDLAASITFWTILSIPAAALALVSALSSLEAFAGRSVANDVEQHIQDFVADTLVDSETLSSAIAELFGGSRAGLATFATLLALFTLSRAFAGLIRAMDIAYEVEDSRSWWQVRLVAIGLGVGTVIVAAGSATVLAILPSLPLETVTRLLSVPAVFAAITLWCATLFHIGPNHRTPWRYDLPGAMFTAIGWVLASQLFALYVRFAGNANQVQSGVGVILLSLTLIYVLSLVLVMGAEVNDVISRRAGVVQEPRSTIEQARSWRDRYQRKST